MRKASPAFALGGYVTAGIIPRVDWTMRPIAVGAAAIVGAMLGVGLAAPAAQAAQAVNDDWVQFRGPGARGVV